MQYITIVGCVIYVDILKPPSLLSQSLQGCELDTVLGIKNIFKATTALNSLARQEPCERPTVKLVLGRIKYEEGDNQGAALKKINPATQKKLKKTPWVT